MEEVTKKSSFYSSIWYRTVYLRITLFDKSSCGQNVDQATENVCKHHNVGYCKYKDKCMFFHATEDCENKFKRNKCLKRHRKTCKHGESCKYKLKCEFRHDEKTDANVSNQISELKKSINELSEQNAKNEERILCLEQNVNEIKAGKQQMSDSIKKLSAELNKLNTMCESFKSPQPPKSTLNDERLVQNNSRTSSNVRCVNRPSRTKRI